MIILSQREKSMQLKKSKFNALLCDCVLINEKGSPRPISPWILIMFEPFGGLVAEAGFQEAKLCE